MRPKRPFDHPHEGLHEVDWSEFAEVCKRLALEIERGGGCDAVVGIGKGGALVGAALAAILRRDFFAIRLSRRHAGEMTPRTTRVTMPPSREVAGRHVLLCDDLSVTGETFKIALLELRRAEAARVTTLALAAHVHDTSFRPDLCGLLSNEAFVFPWDREVLVDGEFRLHPDIEKGLAAQGIKRTR